MFWKIIFLGFLLYILYRFVFGFILPVYKTTQNIKKGFRDMQEKANEQMRQQQGGQQNQQPPGNTSARQESLGEYIDFEEVK
jgi:hypothetical protein